MPSVDESASSWFSPAAEEIRSGDLGERLRVEPCAGRQRFGERVETFGFAYGKLAGWLLAENRQDTVRISVGQADCIECAFVKSWIALQNGAPWNLLVDAIPAPS